MLKRTYHAQNCTVAKSLEVVGERWTLLIVRDALRGVTRFGEFRCRLGVTASVLSTRLNRLTEASILTRERYHDHPPRYDYRLTPQGRELAHVIVSLMRWGDRYLAGGAAPPVFVQHSGCGGRAEPTLTCLRCGQNVSPQDVTPTPAEPSPVS